MKRCETTTNTYGCSLLDAPRVMQSPRPLSQRRPGRCSQGKCRVCCPSGHRTVTNRSIGNLVCVRFCSETPGGSPATLLQDVANSEKHKYAATGRDRGHNKDAVSHVSSEQECRGPPPASLAAHALGRPRSCCSAQVPDPLWGSPRVWIRGSGTSEGAGRVRNMDSGSEGETGPMAFFEGRGHGAVSGL